MVVLPRPQPHPEGLRCLVLSGCLADTATPKPGKVLPIPKVKRLVVSDAGVTSRAGWLCEPLGGVSLTGMYVCIRTYILIQSMFLSLQAHDAAITCATFDLRKVISGSADMTAR